MIYIILCSILFLTLIILTSAQQQNKPGRMTELGGRQLALKQFQPGIHTPEAIIPVRDSRRSSMGNGPCSVWIPDFSKGNLSKNQVCFHKLEVWSDIQTRDHWTGRVDHLNESMIPYSESGSHLSVASKTSMKSTGSHRQVFNIVI